MFAITALLGTIAVLLFIFQVMIVVSDREGSGKSGEAWDVARDGTVETFESVGNVIATGFSVGSGIAGIITIVIVSIFFGLLFLTALGVGVANFGDDISGAFDSAFTDAWPPFYRTVVLGIADPLLSLWNIILPISNSLNGSWRILRSNALQQAIDCPEVDWGDISLKLRDVVLSSLSSVVSWTLGLANDEFDLYTPLRSLQLAIGDIAPVVSCWCEATTLIVNIVTDAIVSHELAAVIDQSLNLILNIFRDVLGGLLQLFKAFGVALFSDDFFTALGDYYWEPNRAPTIDRTVRSVGEIIARLTDWIDDIIVSMGVNLFSLSDTEVPRFFGIVGNYVQAIVLDYNVFYDAMLKPLRYLLQLGTRYDDSAWDESRPVGLRTQALLTDAFVKAYNASALSETFFQTLTVPLQKLNDSVAAADAQELLNLTGCMSHELLDVATSIFEMLLRSAVATFHERLLGGEYGEYIRSSPFSDAIDVALTSSERFADCAGGFFSILNDPLGAQVNETGHVVVAIIRPFVALHEHWNNRSFFWNSTLYSDLVDDVFVELDAYAIATGNFWRQFAFINSTTIDPDVECRLRDPHLEQFPVGTAPDLGDWEDFYPWYVDPFCCLGGAAEEFLRLLFGLVEGITRAIVTFVAEPTLGGGFVESFKTGGPLDLRVEFLPMIDFLLRDLFQFSCIRNGIVRAIAEAYFGGPTIPCGAGTATFWEEMTEVSTGMVRVPIRVVIGGAAEIWSWLVDLVDGAPCGAVCWCSRLKAFYATTGGTIIDWVADLMEFVGCLFESGGQILAKLVQWAGNLRDVLGSEGTIATGDFFCLIAEFFETIWDLFRCWGEGGGFVKCIFDTILASFEELFLAIVDCLKEIFKELKTVILCIPQSTWNWITAFFENWKCLYQETNPCPKLLDYMKKCKFVVPSTCGPGSLGLTTGEVGLTFTELPTETVTTIISECDVFELFSPEWNACIQQTELSTSTAIVTQIADYAYVVKGAQKISQLFGGFGGTLDVDDNFGWSVAGLGDLNLNGVNDVAVGAPGDDGGFVDAGAVWILFLDHDGMVLSEQKIGSASGGFSGTLSAGDEFGSSIANIGDLDGDGIIDLAVGAYKDDDGGTDHGAVWILFMATDGTVQGQQKISDTEGGFTGSLSASDFFGVSAAPLGDLNGDGVLDLVVGSHWEDTGGSNRGAVWILFLFTNGSVSSFKLIASDLNGGPTLEDDGHFGASIALLGDLDKDGVVDIAVGIPEADEGGTDIGNVMILFLRTSGAVKMVQQIGVNISGFLEPLVDSDAFGTSLALIEDFDGDGIQDLLIGAPGDDDGGGSDRGAIYFLMLYTDGSVRDSDKISQTRGGFPNRFGSGDRFGHSVSSIGDLDGDGVEDMIAGAPYDDDGGSAYGATWVTFLGGEQARFRRSTDIVLGEYKISDTFGQFTGSLSNEDRFGWSVTGIGDLDGDGVQDIAVGAPGDDDNITVVGGKGALWILFMTPGGAVKSYQKISDTEGGFAGALADLDRFGTSVAVIGDLDGDNVTDLIVGADGDGDGGIDRGAVWILFMNANGTVKAEQKISDTAGDFGGTLGNFDNFGRAVATLGDMDGDNVTELLVGTPGDNGGGTQRGAVWILFMRANGTVESEVTIDDTTSGFTGILGDGDEFGISVAPLEDLDGNGVVDIAVGAWLDDDGGSGKGAVYIIFLYANGTIKKTQKISDTAGEFQGFLSVNDQFGSSVANIGDLDDDGIPDLVVGAYKDDDGGLLRGAVWVLFMRTSGEVKEHHKISYYQGGFLGHISDEDQFGYSVGAVGDLDGDGAPDVLVGVPSDDDGSINPIANRGAVWILNLRAVKRERIAIAHQKIDDIDGNFGGALDDSDFFGVSVVALGDLNMDNTTDIAVGASGDDDGGSARGAVWVLFMNADLTVASEQKISALSGDFGGTLSNDDRFGVSLTNLGDLDGDNVTDLAVGADGDGDGCVSDCGAVWILFMHTNGTVKAEQKISDVSGGFTGNIQNDDMLGHSVASVGDLDGDNVTELAVGAIGDDAGGSNRGVVWMLFLYTNGTVKKHQRIGDVDGDFAPGGNVLSDGDEFGSSIAALGDLDGDGTFDLAVGAQFDDDGGNGHGAVWILFLRNNGTVNSTQKISSLQGGFSGLLGVGDNFGSGLAAFGDLNNDGIVDLAVGANDDDDGGTNRGAVWLLFLNAQGVVKSEQKISHQAGDFTGGLDDGDLFGSSVAALGDFNSSGTPDLIVGARAADGGGSDRGAAWIVLLADTSGGSSKRRRLESFDGAFEHVLAAAKKRSNGTTSWPAPTSVTLSSSSSILESPQVIDFSDLERWCAEEGTHLTSLSGAVDINENSTQIPEDQKEINRRLINASLYEMGMSYQGCLASAAVSKLVDITIGFVSENDTLVHPKTFYEPMRFLYFASRVVMVAPIVLEYHFERVTQDPRTLTGGAFAAHLDLEHNITDSLTEGLGLFGDRMLRAARLLVYRNRGNLLGYFVNTFGGLLYAPPQLEGAAAVNPKRLIYGSAPLHPKGWQSPSWVDFRDRYAGGLASGYSEWVRAVGFEDRLWTLGYLSDIPSLYRRRIEWNEAGRDPDTEPLPRGRLAQRARYANLLEKEYAPRHVWESDATAEIRSTYARAIRLAKYPSLEVEHETFDQNLILDSVVCPVGVGGADHNCTVRSCWSSDGASVGTCAHRSDIFGRPICGCGYDSLGGACCSDTGCTNVDGAANCTADSVFAPNRTCAMTSTCEAARGACCAQNGTCATVSLPGRCTGNGTFLVGSDCLACADGDLINGACCDSGTCAMTTKVACAGTWNSNRNCSSRALASECRHCGIAPCLSCDLLSATVNDIVDLWILNMELINKSATSGACCHGKSATNRTCIVSARSTCDELSDSTWFWGEQCSFCKSPFSFGMLGQTPPRTVRPLHLERDLERVVLDTFESVVNFFLTQGARIFPSMEGKSFDVDAFVEDVSQFFFSNDGEDPKSWRFWFDFLFFCDVFDHLFPDVGPQGLGIVAGLFWATVILSLVYAILFRCWSFLGGLLSGLILVLFWFLLVLVIAYFYSPACYSPAIIPRYVLRGRTGSVQAQAASSPVAGAGAGVPYIGGRLGKVGSRTAAGLVKAKTFLKNAARQALLFMFSIPMLPVQLGQDVRDDILARFDVDCLPLCDVACPRENGKWPCDWMTEEDAGIDCLDAPDCCAVAECPESRVFPACASEPYNFRGSTRESAYWARVLTPKANCFFLHSDFFLFAWIRQIPGVAEKLDFPGDECDDPDFDDARWRYCGRSNILLLAPWLILLLLFYIFIGAIVVLTWIIFKAAAKFALSVTSFWTAASRNAARATVKPEPEEDGGGVKKRKRETVRGEGRVSGHSRFRAPLKKE